MTNFKILSIVVLYKQNVLDCSTITSMMSLNEMLKNEIFVVVCDNSDQKQDESDLHVLSDCFNDFVYLHSGYNKPLSTLYNSTIASYGHLCSHVNIWDQDSIFNDEYFEQCKNAINQHPEVKLIIPRVFVGDKLVSPGVFKYFKGKYLSCLGTGKTESKNLIGIMSGVFVDLCVFNRVIFDERLRLYGVDTQFFIDYRKRYETIYVLNYVLMHTLSIYDKNELIEVKIFRFKEFCRSSIVIASGRNFLTFLLMTMHLTFLGLKYAMKYRNFGFFNSFVEVFSSKVFCF